MPTYRVHAASWGVSFDAPGDIPILAAAERAGVALPASCRNGTCRTCMSHLREGEIAWAIEWPGLSREEKAEGWILPCVALARSDLVID